LVFRRVHTIHRGTKQKERIAQETDENKNLAASHEAQINNLFQAVSGSIE